MKLENNLQKNTCKEKLGGFCLVTVVILFLIIELIRCGLGHSGVSVLTALQFKLLGIFLRGEGQVDLLLCCHPPHLLWDVQLLPKTTQSNGSYQKMVTTASQPVENKLIKIFWRRIVR